MTRSDATSPETRPDGTGPAARPPQRVGDASAHPAQPAQPPPPGANPAGALFGYFPEEFHRAVVKQALRARKRNPGAARNALDGHLRAALRLPGFRDAAKAPPGQLTLPVLDAIRGGDDALAVAVLNLWVLANAPLREAALAVLRDAGVPPGPELTGGDFHGSLPFEDWLDLREACSERDPEADPDATALMLALAANRLPEPPGGADVRSPRFLAWLDELHALPHDAPEWADAEDFAATVALLANLMAAEHDHAVREARNTAVRRIVDEYSDELRYLAIDLEPWLADGGPDPALTTVLADDLAAVLARYRPVRPQGATLTEEAKRAAARPDLEQAALALPPRWEALPREDPAQAHDGPESPDPAPADGAAAELDDLREAHLETVAERDRLRDANAELTRERDRLDAANASLRLAREQVDTENGRLRGELDLSRSAEEQWRRAYVDARRAGAAATDGAAPATIGSVADALSLAERAFPDALAVSLNARSNPDVPFAKPAEVFDALAWLATCYRRDPGPTIREACPGWFHRTDQSESTVGMYRDWYRTTYRGRTLSIVQHLGKGASFDARSTIRIAFAWDEESERAVVGFIGRHQRNRQS